ncbi:MAG: beta-hydroxyacyl-ACP dehydratase [Bacteriovoracaceae bacterium]|nr:beta-hydroxyacyl-ACP dehydratase [Bacteriovoracaceae bacterium]
MLDKNTIKHFIPHRDPFLFLDYIESIDIPDSVDLLNISLKDIVGTSAIAYYTVSPTHPIFEGHFPGNPIWPGVLQIEAMAQAACFTLNCLEETYSTSKLTVALLGVDGVRFRKPVRPGMILKIISTCSKIRGQIANFESVIYSDDDRVAEGRFMAAFSFEEKTANAPFDSKHGNFT